MAATAEARVVISADHMDPEDEEQICSADSDEDRSDDDADESGADGEEQEDEAAAAADDDDDDDDGLANTGWAEAMAKILAKKTPASRRPILLKNKELERVKEKEKQEQLERKKQSDKKRSWEMMCREKPDLVKDREAEKTLQRVATRGVVQLFNAVRKHQKTIDKKVKEAGGSERRKAKLLSSVSKKDFIDVLRRTEGDARAPKKPEKDTVGNLRPRGHMWLKEPCHPAHRAVTIIPQRVVSLIADRKAAAEEKAAWTVLREDFMMGATMKDWDKDSDAEDAGNRCGTGD